MVDEASLYSDCACGHRWCDHSWMGSKWCEHGPLDMSTGGYDCDCHSYRSPQIDSNKIVLPPRRRDMRGVKVPQNPSQPRRDLSDDYMMPPDWGDENGGYSDPQHPTGYEPV